MSDTTDLTDFSPRTGLFGSSSDGYGQCCPPVFDPYTLLALIGGIALATYFLRLVIVTTTFNGRAFGLINPLSKYRLATCEKSSCSSSQSLEKQNKNNIIRTRGCCFSCFKILIIRWAAGRSRLAEFCAGRHSPDARGADGFRGRFQSAQ